MKLTKVRITNFQCIHDSTEFDIGDITCLVGKNESGKTALLKALYRLNPINTVDGAFEPMDDYPRENLEEYEIEVATGKREPAQVVQAAYTLDREEINAIEGVFGHECLKDETPTVIIEKGYSNQFILNNLNVNTDATLKHLVENAGLRASRLTRLLKMKTIEEKINFSSIVIKLKLHKNCYLYFRVSPKRVFPIWSSINSFSIGFPCSFTLMSTTK